MAAVAVAMVVEVSAAVEEVTSPRPFYSGRFAHVYGGDLSDYCYCYQKQLLDLITTIEKDLSSTRISSSFRSNARTMLCWNYDVGSLLG